MQFFRLPIHSGKYIGLSLLDRSRYSGLVRVPIKSIHLLLSSNMPPNIDIMIHEKIKHLRLLRIILSQNTLGPDATDFGDLQMALAIR
jgi:hypothetical protein